MDSQTAQLLEKLAEQLGTTTAYLWPKLVAYTYSMYLGWVIYIIIASLICAGIIGICTYHFLKVVLSYEKDDDRGF